MLKAYTQNDFASTLESEPSLEGVSGDKHDPVARRSAAGPDLLDRRERHGLGPDVERAVGDGLSEHRELFDEVPACDGSDAAADDLQAGPAQGGGPGWRPPARGGGG